MCNQGMSSATAAFRGSIRSIPARFLRYLRRSRRVLAALLLAASLGTLALAQTTTISGTVYDPRTTASALPLPNVLVYLTTGSVAPLASGAQCLTASSASPAGAVSFTNTAVDGSFTLGNVPTNASYTLVIQAGKWRRQFAVQVADTPLAVLALHMPSDHTQGDIPMIAIATGSVDALECVLRDMGIADSEFTDDNDISSGSRVHLYKGWRSPGAQISASTPTETTLMANATLLGGYDMVMFPCQGSPAPQPASSLTNLLNYTTAGGRVFATHYSFDRLDPNSPYNSQFPPVAAWTANMTGVAGTQVAATIDTGFTDGAMLAQWLKNAGASTTYSKITLSYVANNVSGVIAPTQPWGTVDSNDSIVQITFNTPVGAAAADQCGRVLFTEYHVKNSSGGGMKYPSECPSTPAMSAQEEMLEYALFDLSTFVTPVVVPTVSIAFNPSLLIVKQGDSADQVTVNVTNTSATSALYSSTVLTLTLPPGLTATSLTDATGGWICTLGTLTCTRTTGIGASSSDAVTLTVSVPPYAAGSSATGAITATVSSPSFSTNIMATDPVVFQQQPGITWANPANIIYGTALSGTQLNATSPLAGSFSYTPPAGTVLDIGQHTLTATFTPTDAVDYTPATATVTLTVVPATPLVTVAASPNPAFLTYAVTFTASVSSSASAPTGTVVFSEGTSQLGTGTVTAGVASFTTSALTAGIHSITAVYSGDAHYSAATSGTLSETIEDFKLAFTGSGAVTAPPGTQAAFSLVMTPVGGPTMPAAISLTVSGLPLGATAVFSPTSEAAGSGTSNVTLQVSLPSQAAVQPMRRPFGGSPLPVALALILLPFAARLRKAASRFNKLLVLALIGTALAVGMTGCGATFKAQSYSLTITATSGSLSHSTVVKLTVQSASH
jgi:hypothetical protein